MEFKDRVQKLLLANRRKFGDEQYTVPSPGTYPYQWLWDSCFHSIILAKTDPDAAKAELKALLSRQYPDGLIPHIIFWTPKITRPYGVAWKNNISSITQPPMIAYAAWEIYQQTKDVEFLKEIFPKMLLFYRYLIEQRDPHDHHMVSIINPDESGEDNSPRFDTPMHVKSNISFFGHMWLRYKLVAANAMCNFDVGTCMTNQFWVKDIPFNTILVKNLEVLAKIAGVLGDEKTAEYALRHQLLLKESMRTNLFRDGVYWPASGPDHTILKVATWAHFVPLFAGLYTKEEAEEVIKNHFNNEKTFKSKYGIRTVSKQEPSYRSNAFWRGPIWFAPHWFIYKGLMDYGFIEEAKWIRDTSKGLIDKNGFREYFDGETGKAYGARNFTWGTLVLDMLQEN
jgi:glycogen debranching enzyme